MRERTGNKIELMGWDNKHLWRRGKWKQKFKDNNIYNHNAITLQLMLSTNMMPCSTVWSQPLPTDNLHPREQCLPQAPAHSIMAFLGPCPGPARTLDHLTKKKKKKEMHVKWYHSSKYLTAWTELLNEIHKAKEGSLPLGIWWKSYRFFKTVLHWQELELEGRVLTLFT